MATLKPNQMLC